MIVIELNSINISIRNLNLNRQSTSRLRTFVLFGRQKQCQNVEVKTTRYSGTKYLKAEVKVKRIILLFIFCAELIETMSLYQLVMCSVVSETHPLRKEGKFLKQEKDRTG